MQQEKPIWSSWCLSWVHCKGHWIAVLCSNTKLLDVSHTEVSHISPSYSKQIFLPTRLQWKEKEGFVQVADSLLDTNSDCHYEAAIPSFSSSHHWISMGPASTQDKCCCILRHLPNALSQLSEMVTRLIRKKNGRGVGQAVQRKKSVSPRRIKKKRDAINKGVSITDATPEISLRKCIRIQPPCGSTAHEI